MITFLNLYKYGRLGNQMFHIASTIGVATKFNLDFGFIPWKESQHFRNVLPPLDAKMQKAMNENPNYLRKFHRIAMPFDYQQDYLQSITDGAMLDGCMFSWKYFEHCEDIVKYFFKMNEIKGLPKISKNSIGFHFRGGDYGTKFFPRLTVDYYRKALETLGIVLGHRKNYELYVFSDEIETAKRMFSSAFTFIETGDPIKDFYLFRQCRHFVCSNSTFSFWACYLGEAPDKIVIAPKNWFTDEFAYTAKDIYYKDWIIV